MRTGTLKPRDLKKKKIGNLSWVCFRKIYILKKEPGSSIRKASKTRPGQVSKQN